MRPTLLFGVLLVVVAVAASAISGVVHRDLAQTNSTFILFPVELLALPIGGAVAARYLRAQRGAAAAMLGVGMYQLIVAGAVSTVFPLWLPSDDTILGSALLAGIWAGVGANLLLASAATLHGSPRVTTYVASSVAGILAFLLVTSGGMVEPLFRLELPILTLAALAIAALLISRSARLRLLQPLALAVAVGAATVAVLVIRGPADWASASTSLKLYSFPILVLSLGMSLLIIEFGYLSAAARAE